jgi:hypothetical protein
MMSRGMSVLAPWTWTEIWYFGFPKLCIVSQLESAKHSVAAKTT